MREILFKAKRKDNGEWVEGDLITNPCYGTQMAWISSEDSDKARLRSVGRYKAEWRAVEVYVDTICQYTGLTDKNGRKIWENDIVSIESYGYGSGIGDIEFYDGLWYVNGTVNDSLYDSNNNAECMQVIGNIFDNADLLEVEE